jgi:hypothetical protein
MVWLAKGMKAWQSVRKLKKIYNYEENSEHSNNEASYHSCYSDIEEDVEEGHNCSYEGEFFMILYL